MTTRLPRVTLELARRYSGLTNLGKVCRDIPAGSFPPLRSGGGLRVEFQYVVSSRASKCLRPTLPAPRPRRGVSRSGATRRRALMRIARFSAGKHLSYRTPTARMCRAFRPVAHRPAVPADLVARRLELRYARHSRSTARAPSGVARSPKDESEHEGWRRRV